MENWQTAVGGCIEIDLLRRDMSPEKLQEVQEKIAIGLLNVEQRLRILYGRRVRRYRRIKSRLQKNPELRTFMQEHKTALKSCEELLEHRRTILRELGDACAWLVLRNDPRLIVPLYKPGRVHHLPEGIGIEGPFEVLNSLHTTGQFLVIDNDLTRCLGIGDITIVRAGKSWYKPLPVEIKSSLIAENIAEINFLSPYADHPDYADLFKEVCEALGLTEDASETGSQIDQRATRQVNELLEHTSLLFRLDRAMAERAKWPRENHWRALGKLLNNAYIRGYAFDIPEPGMVYQAVRIQDGDDPVQALEVVVERTRSEIAGRSSGATIIDLHEQELVSTLVPPIALWPISGDLRNALLSRRLFFAVVIEEDIWDRAFAAVGMSRTQKDGLWTITDGFERATLDHIEVAKLTFGAVFSGISPHSSAEALQQAFIRATAIPDDSLDR